MFKKSKRIISLILCMVMCFSCSVFASEPTNSCTHIKGELNIDNYEKDGEKRSFTKVKVDRLEFLASNSNNENKANANALEYTGFQQIDDNDDIPF